MLKANPIKSCKVCGSQFRAWTTDRQLNRLCSVDCATRYALTKRRKEAEAASRAENRLRKRDMESIPLLTKRAQAAFNEYVRERDYGKPCISCGSTVHAAGLKGGRRDCGHYRSTGAAPHLRFDTLNAWAQCKRCNRELSGNAVEYRKGLIRRIGKERVESLEHDNRERKYNKEQLRRIARIFRARARLYRRIRDNLG